MQLPFVQSRQPRWSRLEEILHKAEKNKLSSFTKDDLIEFTVLYRQTATDLAMAKTQKLPVEIVEFLNHLVSRAYHYVYRTEKTSLNQMTELVSVEFPVLVRQNWPVILFAFALMAAGWALGFFGYLTGPQIVTKYLPKRIVTEIFHRYQTDTWFNDPLVARPYISLFIMQNNIRVALAAFAGGMLLGTLTFFSILYNGFLLGVLSALFWQKGHFLSFWAMVLPHGVIELTSIGLAAAAGFVLVKIILFPGEYSRSDALRIHGTKAMKLLFGTVCLLVVAGLIEGFFSTTTTKIIPESARLLFAGFTAFLLIVYFWPRSSKRGKSKDPAFL